MYASVHTDRSGRVFVSDDHRAAGFDGSAHVALMSGTVVPQGTRLVPLEREATALDRGGRARPLGRGRLALAAILPPGHVRLLFPAYADDRAAAALEPLAYAAVGADASGELVVAASETVRSAGPASLGAASEEDVSAALRARPTNRLMRQLARCARDHECRAARAALVGQGDLPVPLGAPPAERPRIPVALRSGYPGSPSEPAAIHPTAADVEELAREHLARGARIAFGRGCDGEPLLAVRVMEEAMARIRERHAGAEIHLETSGCDAAALRRAIDAGVSSVTVRLGSARPDTYELLHGPLSHRWSDVRASLQLAGERGIRLGVALLLLPGVTDRAAEIDAIVTLLGELPGGTLELRDLGADPARALAAFPRGRPLGMRALLDRLAEADHFPLGAVSERAAV